MSFLFPATLALAVLAPVIAILYLRRPKRREMSVSTLQFWQKVLEKQPHRAFLGRLRNPYSLLLQLLIFALLLLALARPDWGREPDGQSTIIVLDGRARMQAGETFHRATAAARAIASQAGPGNEVAVIVMEGAPQILSPFSSDSRDLRERLEKLSPSDAGGNLTDALNLAETLLQGRQGKTRLALISDRRIPAGENVEQILVGAPGDNLALLALAQRPMPTSPQSAEIYARIGNFAAGEQTAELELALDGRSFDLKKLRLAAGEEKDFITIVPEEMLRSGQGLLTARLTQTDALAGDNTARAALRIGQRQRVLLVTKDNPFLEGALRADAGLALEILSPELWSPATGEGFDAVIFDDWMPDQATPEDFSRGHFLFFGRSPFDSGNTTPFTALETPAPDHPLLWNVDLTPIQPKTLHKLNLPEDTRATVILASASDPVLATLERAGQSRAVVATFGVNDTLLPLRVGFPLFISNALNWLAGRDQTHDSYQAGQIHTPKEGERIALAPGEDAKETTETALLLRKNGFYRITETESVRFLAVNTGSAEESDLRGTETTPSAWLPGRVWGALPPWQWLALIALTLILAEWSLYHRRLTE